MPSLDKKYTMEPEEDPVCAVEFKLLKEAMAKMESNMHELSLKKQEDDVAVIHSNEIAVMVVSFWLLGTTLRIPKAELVFKDIDQVNVVSWNSLIAGYAFNGHVGQVDESLKLFKCMTEVYGIEPLVEHYACLVDLLGRTGRLHEAFDMVRGMKMKPNAGIWDTLLGACQTHQNLELGKIAAEKLLELEPQKASHYAL
ncbi:hypothetical protein Patl1_00002 [Pistacia atlantica]|uniref:Uncharacterized protein n=1 Tax=Pistacia atlantica TaxID=434234 RepID=A0ACC1CBY1_9ROSI|nr:hypothetical protein Patl1_00002 [Pistacia atlantica]